MRQLDVFSRFSTARDIAARLSVLASTVLAVLVFAPAAAAQQQVDGWSGTFKMEETWDDRWMGTSKGSREVTYTVRPGGTLERDFYGWKYRWRQRDVSWSAKHQDHSTGGGCDNGTYQAWSEGSGNGRIASTGFFQVVMDEGGNYNLLMDPGGPRPSFTINTRSSCGGGSTWDWEQDIWHLQTHPDIVSAGDGGASAKVLAGERVSGGQWEYGFRQTKLTWNLVRGDVADRDGDGVPDSTDKCPDQHGKGSADGCPPPVGDCRETGGQQRVFSPDYAARVALFGLPDVDLFRFQGNVRYCFDGKTARMIHAAGFGAVDYGFDTGVLENLGFTVRYDSTEEDVRWANDTAVLTGDFDVQFKWLTLVDRVGLTKAAKKRLAKEAEKALARRLARYDHRELAPTVLKWTAKQNTKLLIAADEMLPKLQRVLPDRLAEEVHKLMYSKLKDKLTEWRNETVAYFSTPNLVKKSTSAYASFIVDSLYEKLEGLTTSTFSVWTPTVTVTALPNGEVASSLGGTNNFLLQTSENPTQSEPTPLAPKTARLAATSTARSVRLARVRKGKGTPLRLVGDPGTVTLDVLARDGVRASAKRAKPTLLARGKARFAKRGWRTLTIKPTRAGRATANKARRVRATVKVTVKPTGGKAVTQTRAVTLK